MPRAEDGAVLEEQVALATSSPARRTCWPGVGGLGDPHLGDAAVGPLVGHDRVGAGRHRRAGHDLDRGAGRQREQLRLAGADLADDRQVHRVRRRWRWRRRRAHGVAVHRGVVEARQRDRRGDVLGGGRPRASSSGCWYGGSGWTASRIRSRWSSTGSGASAIRRPGAPSPAGDALRPSSASSSTSPMTRTPWPKVQSPSTRQRVGLAQRRRALGEALVEVADQLVVVGVELDERHLVGGLVEHEVLAEVVDVGAQHQQVVGRLDRDEPVAADLDGAARPRRPRSPRPSRSRSGSPRAWTGRPGRGA